MLEGKVDSISAADWHVSELDMQLELTDAGLSGRLHIARIELPAAGLDLADTRIDCEGILLTATRFTCERGVLDANLPGIGRHRIAVQFTYERRTGTTHITLPQLPVAGSNVRVRASVDDTTSTVHFDGEALQLEALVELANAFGAGLDDLTAAGQAAVSGTLETRGDGSLKMSLNAQLLDASLANPAGTAVTDALRGDLAFTALLAQTAWQIDASVTADRGEAYFEPVYANLSEHAIELRVTGMTTADFVTFRIPQFHVEQQSLMTLDGKIAVTLPGDDTALALDGRIEFTDTSVAAVYSSLLQVLAAGTILGDLETAGRVSGALTLADSTVTAANIKLNDVALDDRQRRFAVYGLHGRIDWPGTGAEAADTLPSHLAWDSAAAFGIVLGGATLDARLGGNDLELLKPLRIPTMGGALTINRLAMQNYGSDEARGLLDAQLEPIQLGQLTSAFDWPAFSGSLSGQLPTLHYEGNAMTVGGRLTASAFDGDIEVENLRLEQPFGRVPRLYADLRLRNLDLERITSTFSFGLIQGRLSGDVTGLELVDWRPVAMDLHLYTPPDDPSRHRISQRAVENLASVGGGGAAAALSSGLLKFFEVFAYDRIGLRCVLVDGTCAMSGAGAAGDGPSGRGYYIVKGSGLPRIDVIGYRNRVSWQSLVNQLANITKSEGPVVK
ncbi:MAG: hypothetical protein WD078_02765 [Woeseia sp.]